ncbi:hypothetical protein cyc_08901 [Cyclospora cayetanensis]|uniref:Uncharacterized protein n=1 Tax=Cyclospora cayetanensis TaxID=88456 RepID=A0A1D3D4G4_9EIME|nr:hypothetical protein cyc_08901 [Cyclospora cayetanensis]
MEIFTTYRSCCKYAAAFYTKLLRMRLRGGNKEQGAVLSTFFVLFAIFEALERNERNKDVSRKKDSEGE